MDVSIASFFTLNTLSTGRRLFAMQKVAVTSDAAGLDAIAAHCNAAIAADQHTRDLEARWANDTNAACFPPGAWHIDIQIDVALGALRDAIDAEARDAEPGDALAAVAARLVRAAFPDGVAAITTLGYIEQLNQVQRIIALLQSPAWAPQVVKLGLERRLRRLVELEHTYVTALSAPARTISFADVKTARLKGQTMMLQAVAMILGHYPSDSNADMAGRTLLLRPILEQNEAIRAYVRDRRPVEDVNPSTGEVERVPAATPPPSPVPPAP